MATVYGIDTGSWRVRIAAMEGTFRRYEIRDAAAVAVGADRDGNPLHADAIALLRAEEPGWDAADKVAAMPLDQGVIRLVKLPFADKTAIARALPAEVESQVPYDLEDMVLGTRLIDVREGGSRSAVFIAPRVELRARIDTLKAAAAEPRVLAFDADALSSYADRGVQVVVDVGHRRTVLALCQGGQLLAARLIPLGGASFTDAIARHGNFPWEAAEEQKHAMSLHRAEHEVRADWDDAERTDASWTPPTELAGALDAAVEAWCVEVRAELIALEDELTVGIDDLLVCGGSSKLAGLGERLAARTGVPARPVVVSGGHGAEYALAVALARVGAGELRVVDLRAGEFAYHGTAETLWRAFAATVVGGGLFLAAAATLFTVQYVDASRRMDELDVKIAEAVTATFPGVTAEQVTGPSVAVAIMQEKTAETTQRVDALGATVSGVPPTLDMLKEISERVPPPSEARIDVRELTITEAAVTMKAETDTFESAAKIEEALQKASRFKNARKADEKKVGTGLTFTMNIPLEGSEPDAEGKEG